MRDATGLGGQSPPSSPPPSSFPVPWRPAAATCARAARDRRGARGRRVLWTILSRSRCGREGGGNACRLALGCSHIVAVGPLPCGTSLTWSVSPSKVTCSIGPLVGGHAAGLCLPRWDDFGNERLVWLVRAFRTSPPWPRRPTARLLFSFVLLNHAREQDRAPLHLLSAATSAANTTRMSVIVRNPKGQA